MASFVDVKKTLRSQDPERLREIIPEYIRTDPGNHQKLLLQMMYLAAHEQLESSPPLGLIYLDAIRDLTTLYEDIDGDLWPLYRTALDYFCTLRLGEYEKETITIRPEDMGQIVLVDEFVEYVHNSERDLAIHEALKLIWLMDNIFYLVEILTEVAAALDQDEGIPLILAGAVLKSVDFVDRARLNPLVFLLTDYLSLLHGAIPFGAESAEYEGEILFEPYYAAIFEQHASSPFDLLYITYAQQIWEGVRMKDFAIRGQIFRYLETHFDNESVSPTHREYKPFAGDLPEILHALRSHDEEKAHALILGYARDGKGLGTLFREITNLFLEAHQADRPIDLLQLNAYRTTLASIQPPEQYQALLKAADLVMETVA